MIFMKVGSFISGLSVRSLTSRISPTRAKCRWEGGRACTMQVLRKGEKASHVGYILVVAGKMGGHIHTKTKSRVQGKGFGTY